MTGPLSIEALQEAGFVGFATVADLRASRCRQVPPNPGVYVVLRDGDSEPEWLDKSTGGWFNHRNPSVTTTFLAANWVAGTAVIYIGRSNDIHKRLRLLVDFGAGKPVAHWGGRLIWQVAGSEGFRVAWLPSASPEFLEAGLIQGFVDAFRAMPFGNLRR